MSRLAEPRVENPDHESLVARFGQLDDLLLHIIPGGDISRALLEDARALAKLIRKQVVK